MARSRHEEHRAPYRALVLMAVLSFAAMYVLMYAMVDRFANVYANINQVYMAALMAAPMVLIELAVMRRMYSDTKLNLIATVACAIVMVGSFIGIRGQLGVTDRQFLRSMIPHHASAVLMCNRAPVRDPELVALCRDIRAGQEADIEQMQAKLATPSP